MKTLFYNFAIIFTILFVLLTACEKSNTSPSCPWETLKSGAPYNLNAVFFTDSVTGYAVGGTDGALGRSIIIKTKDGGNTWTEKNEGRVCSELTSVFFVGQTGYAVGYDNYSVDTNYYNKGAILKTIDGGEHWKVLTKYKYEYLSSLYFFSSDSGCVVGNTILTTFDGGENWTEHQGPYSMKLNAVFAIGKSVYATLENSSFYHYNSIVKTTDNFDTWSVSVGYLTSDFTPNITDIYFTDEKTGYFGMKRNNGALFKTINGGTQWAELETGTTQDLHSIFFLNAQKGYVVGGDSYAENQTSVILKTMDAGSTWIVQPTNSIKAILRSVFFIANTGYAVGDNGTILKIKETIN